MRGAAVAFVFASLWAAGCGAPPSPPARPQPRPAPTPAPAPAPSASCSTAAPAGAGTITSVLVRGTGDASFCKAITSRAGAPPSEDTVEADVRRLHDGGRVDDVTVVEESEGTATALVFEVKERAKLIEVEVVGAPPGVDGPKAVGGAPAHYDPAWVRWAEAELVEALAWQGYRKAVVEHAVTPVPEGGVVVRLVAKPGKRFALGSVRFEGLGKAPPDRLKRDFAMQPGEPAPDDMIERDTLMVSSALYDLGMIEASVTSRVEENFLASSIDVVFTVTEGAIYRLGEVRVEGEHALPKARYAPILAKLKRGSTFVRSDIAAVIQEIERLHRDAGTPRSVVVETKVDPKGRVVGLVLRVE